METEPVTEIQERTFHCQIYDLDMPAAKQRGFCAIQFRKGREICIECERGKAAAKENAEEVRAALPATDEKVRIGAQSRKWEVAKSRKEVESMASNKLCSCGCGKRAVKDGLAFKCYRAKNGVPPWGSKKTTKRSGGQGSSSSKGKRARANGKSNGHECEGCKVLKLQLDEIGRVEKVMVAAGLVPAEKFEKARNIVRELHK